MASLRRPRLKIFDRMGQSTRIAAPLHGDLIGRRILFGGTRYIITSVKLGDELPHGVDYCAGKEMRGSGGCWLPVSDARERLTT
jgi:hypothetical protein